MTVAPKPNEIIPGSFRADYQGDSPSFLNFGTFLKLIPMYEALQLGFNVIFFDADVALIQDPLPYLTLGTADFIVSTEVKSCAVFPSLLRGVDWNHVQPNT
eukprot:gene33806-41704_t